jgi:uncharacterized YigZ family protein
MSDSYLVPAGCGEAELVEKKSRFIARVWRTDTEAEALECLRKTREKHRDATHNVYAYIIRENSLTRYSDDGEPSGTSGMPTLNVFAGEQIQNVCCVVTRYFGGTLLGTGGLARAYAGAAKLALESAGVARMALWQIYELDCDYSFYEIAKRVCEDFGAVIRSSDFGAKITILVAVAENAASLFEKSLTDSSAGKVKCRCLSSEFIGVRIPFGQSG